MQCILREKERGYKKRPNKTHFGLYKACEPNLDVKPGT